MPMSDFDPSALPDPGGKRVVFACRSGNRSVSASLIAQHAGLPYTAHLAGGIKAWKQCALPTATCFFVSPGCSRGIHDFLARSKTWMAGHQGVNARLNGLCPAM